MTAPAGEPLYPDALHPEDAANLVERKALSALGASSAVVVTLGDFPPPPASVRPTEHVAPVLRVVHAIGLPEELRALVDQLPLDAPVPLAEVARDGIPLFLPDANDLRRYPAWGEAMIAAGAASAAIVPVWANGELRGVLGLAWPTPQIFDEDERAFVLTLGVMCAQAIMRAHLRAAERIASEEAVAARVAAESATEAAIAARAVAEAANESKARFVATISHELRSPMNAVLGYTQLIADETDGPVTAMQRDHLGRMTKAGRHLLGLVEQLLGFARIEAGEEAVHAVPVLLTEIVEQTLTIVRPLAEQKGLRLTVVAPETPLELYTDQGKVRQILINLIANAVKFCERGDVLLLLHVEGVDAEVRVYFEVTDTGKGISAAHQLRVFEPFWRVYPVQVHEGGSTGLGLAVARQLARLLGGDVVIANSELERGSTFILSLPQRYTAP